ncbi:apoptosis-associated speck-like protein containing a CARD [Mustela nigripes]|uniref:apoptosis-associated speck-like protein containing a CARD n=1 Tax=Mustela lutreola TaxID=9666 RepID=UPI0027973378|nr:apoptosis-associated speck-like protein containing a CARD [Mustela lutreola]XP_059271926.1 apoptosis-associated speck-like protein containing a CARD [Mustela nigripes]
MGCTRDAILDALENLTADEFKKFKLKLLSVPLREGYGRIPRGTLMSMDAIDLTDKLVSSYLEEYSTELTVIVLREMGMQETAEHLQIKCTGPAPGPAGIQDHQTGTSPAPHFVDRHRAALITRVTDVEGVLDALYGTVLSGGQYEAVRAEPTNTMKMRKLLSFAPAWDKTCKDLLLQALRNTHPYLVADLEKS